MSDLEKHKHVHPEGDSLLSIDRHPLPFIIMAGLFCGLLVVSAAIGSKVITVFGITPGASVLAFSITFICTDTISELYGKRRAQQLVWAGLVVLVVSAVLFQIAIRLPAAEFWKNQDAYSSVLGTSTRIFAVGLISYLVSQIHDVWAFHFWRRVTRGRYLWFRNNASTAVSQLINSIIFVGLVFGTSVPLVSVIASHFVVKMAIAAADTPVVYALVWWLRKRDSALANPSTST